MREFIIDSKTDALSLSHVLIDLKSEWDGKKPASGYKTMQCAFKYWLRIRRAYVEYLSLKNKPYEEEIEFRMVF